MERGHEKGRFVLVQMLVLFPLASLRFILPLAVSLCIRVDSLRSNFLCQRKAMLSSLHPLSWTE